MCTAAAWSSCAEATVYSVPPDAVPASLASGDVVNLGTGGSFPDGYSIPVGAVLNADGGEFSQTLSYPFLQAYGEVNVFSYPTTSGFVECHDTSVLNIFGGSIQAASKGQVNVYGGGYKPADSRAGRDTQRRKAAPWTSWTVLAKAASSSTAERCTRSTRRVDRKSTFRAVRLSKSRKSPSRSSTCRVERSHEYVSLLFDGVFNLSGVLPFLADVTLMSPRVS